MMKNDNLHERIAGNFTANDWKTRKNDLISNGDEEKWDKIFNDFLLSRLSNRYFNPIEVLQKNGNCVGEGFTIVSVQCALIEFLAALKLGKNYKFPKRGEKINKYEYTNSNNLFCDFLVREGPFKDYFTEISYAREFYRDVRCALLHEARTKGGWRVWASGGVSVDVNNKIVRRDELQCSIRSYLCSYKSLLMKDNSTQEAFIRKFDNLADI